MVSSEGTEHEALLKVLGLAREYVVESLDGLSDDSLRRPILPSSWTCLGLINHLALDVEQFLVPGGGRRQLRCNQRRPRCLVGERLGR